MDGMTMTCPKEIEDLSKALIGTETGCTSLANRVSGLVQKHKAVYTLPVVQEAGYHQCEAMQANAELMRAAQLISEAGAIIGQFHCSIKERADQCGVDTPVVAFR